MEKKKRREGEGGGGEGEKNKGEEVKFKILQIAIKMLDTYCKLFFFSKLLPKSQSNSTVQRGN